MSLVGNLEDLSLGDILQIISLSQKSGVLVLESGEAAGRIVFRGGLVQAACVKGVPGQGQDLRGLIIGADLLDPAGFDALAARAADKSLGLEDALALEVGVDAAQIETLVGNAVEAAIIEMFGWQSGDFSFDVRTDLEDEDPQLVLNQGLNAQYLAMEGLRVCDERAYAAGADAGSEADDEPDPILADDVSAEAMFGVVSEEAPLSAEPLDAVDCLAEIEPLDALNETADLADLELPEPLASKELNAPLGSEGDLCEDPTATSIVVEAVLEKEADPEITPEGMAERVHHARPLIVIDPDVAALEWTKNALQDDFDHVHVFQRAEQGLNRIRQYLIRGQLPVVLISPDAEVDPLSGIHGLPDFVKRLKSQAPKLPMLGLIEAGSTHDEGRAALPQLLDAVLSRPARRRLREDGLQSDDAPARSLAGAISAHLAS